MSVIGTSSARRTPATQADPNEFHQRLSHFNRIRLSPTTDTWGWQRRLEQEYEMRLVEGAFVEGERQAVIAQTEAAPKDPDGFVRWFEELRQTGPGQGDPLFPWLAQHASHEQMTWFLLQEVAGEAGFEDLVAMTQVKIPTEAKLEMARNYWDEMGQGHLSGMHGPLLERLAKAFNLEPRIETTVWESLALGNLMVALATNRRYAYQSIGALGIIEQTAPGRAEQVNAGLKRLGVAGEERRYFALHATLDVKHSEAWNREVLRSLVAADPTCATFIAEGALMRLRAGARCFERYREHFSHGGAAFNVDAPTGRPSAA